MVLKINPKIKFDESKESFIPKKAFEFFSTYFTYKEQKKESGYGLMEFVFNYRNISHFSNEELCQAACLIIPYNRGFENGDPNITILQKLKGRRVTAEKFIQYTKKTHYPELKEFSAEFLNQIATTIGDKWGAAWLNSDNLVEHHNEYKKIISEFNQDRKQPCNLEKIVELESAPVAMRFDEKGSLYVVDKKGKLHSFQGTEKVDEHQLPFNFNYVTSKYMGEFLEEGTTLLPNIFIKDDLLYLTTGKAVQTFNLNKKSEKEGLEKFTGGIKIQSEEYHLKYHDCLINNDFILMSFSNYTKDHNQVKRYIAAKTKEGEKTIFSGNFPRNVHEWGRTHWTCEEFTLRMDIHNGVLYIPSDQGISMFDGKETKDIIKAYNDGGDWLSGIYPTTKFSFGEDFLVTMLRVKGSNYMAIGIFEPKYENEGLIKEGDMQIPSSFDLKYMMPMPQISSPTMKHGNIAAYGSQFVTSDTLFNQLNFYRMQE